MSLLHRFFYMLIITSIVGVTVDAKNITEAELDSAFVYLIAKNTTWPEEKKFQGYHIAFVEEDGATQQAFSKLTQGIDLKNKPIYADALSLDEFLQKYRAYELVYLSREYSQNLQKLKKVIPKNFPIMIISNESEDYDNIMVNLYYDTRNKKNIQINLQNILEHKLNVTNDVILTGGKEMSISRLFQSSIIALKKQEKEYSKYKMLNKELQKKIEAYEANIAHLNQQLADVKKRIATTQRALKQKDRELLRKNTQLQKIMKQASQERVVYLAQKKKNEQLLSQYTQLKEEFNTQKNNIAKQNRVLEAKEKIIAAKENLVKTYDAKIASQRSELKKQHSLLEAKSQQIKMQSTLLVLVVIIGGLLAVVAWLMFRNKQKTDMLNERLQEAKAKAEYANQSKSMFIANMSHELRTPLNAIIGFSQLLAQDSSVPQEKKDILKTIYKSGVFLLSMINDILDLSKIEARKIVLHPQPTELHALIEDVLLWLRSRAEEKGLKLELVQQAQVPQCVLLDADKLKQVLINLITNAIKYSTKGTVRLNVDSDTNFIYIDVADEGVGISEENIKRIFKPFTQVGEATDRTGAGLGLTITKKFVDAMGGEISVQSSVGKGSVFRVKIPYQLSEKCEIREKTPVYKSVIGIRAAKKPSIALIDTNEETLQLLSMMLQKIGCYVHVFKSFSEIEAHAQTDSVDLMFVDKNCLLKNKNRLQYLKKKYLFKVVVMGASIDAQEQKLFKKMKFEGYIIKPYTMENVYEALERYLHVKFLYAEETTGTTVSVFTVEDLYRKLSTVDVQILEKIFQKAVLLNVDEFQGVIKEIQSVDKELANMLAYFADKLMFDVILEAIEKTKSKL